MSDQQPTLSRISIIVRDMAAALAFYRRLGLDIPDGAEEHVHFEVETAKGLGIEFDTLALTKAYDPGWQEPSGGSRTIFVFNLPSREAVDDLFGELRDAGYNGQQEPFDAFWGQRYATVKDPDGNVVGFASPVDPDRRSAPPAV